MKRILVPTDFSECAGNATQVAFDFVKKKQMRRFIFCISCCSKFLMHKAG